MKSFFVHIILSLSLVFFFSCKEKEESTSKTENSEFLIEKNPIKQQNISERIDSIYFYSFGEQSAKGKIYKHIEYYSNGDVKIEKEYEYYEDKKLKWVVNNYFDSTGRKIYTIRNLSDYYIDRHAIDKKTYDRIDYSYLNDSTVLESVFRNGGRWSTYQFENIIYYSFDYKKRITKERKYEGKGVYLQPHLRHVLNYNYDKNDNIVEERIYNTDGTLAATQLNKYSQANLLTETEILYPNQRNNLSCIYSYDKNNLLISSLWRNYSNEPLYIIKSLYRYY